MEEKSALEEFLSRSQSVGETDSEGSFTLARERAIAKLANSQLPYNGAWAVKIVQAIVAAQTTERIDVLLKSNETHFCFPAESAWTIDEVEASFFDPEPGTSRSLNHLISGLWYIGLKEERAFQLSFPGQSESLVWDGSSFSRLKLKSPNGMGFINVSRGSRASGAFSWAKNLLDDQSENLRIARALRLRCFASPVPLLLDGERIDSLQLCPDYGWTPHSYPLDLKFEDNELPPLTIPQGTFDDLDSYQLSGRSGSGQAALGIRQFINLKPRLLASVTCLLATHLDLYEAGTSGNWQTLQRPSKCFWISDGVFVDSDEFKVPFNTCTFAVFLNGDDLETDLTGMRLLESEERTRRILRAAEVIPPLMFENYKRLPLEDVATAAKGKYRLLAGLFGVLGATIIPAVSILGGGLLVTAATLAYKGGNKERKIFAGLHGDLRRLFKAFWRTYPASQNNENEPQPNPLEDVD